MEREEAQQPELDPAFVNDVKKYIELGDEIQAARRDIKVVREEMTKLEEAVLQYMVDNKIDQLVTPGGAKISTYTSRQVQPLKKEHILQQLSVATKSEKVAQEFTDAIFENRQYKETTKIKRTKGAGKK